MSSTNIYYKKIMERFGKKTILESESNSTTADAQSEKSHSWLDSTSIQYKITTILLTYKNIQTIYDFYLIVFIFIF